ncbi:PP2C family protein-serine/threonine phosphatase [Modestobacter sp. VKM Ac-2984]|uniref:PP2C family protein-serine/threonine phosphatase n=1 Tax=Modestobacter sp. VKM Ac-2984 TaxID=3004138 RepID=UPI0022AAB224|nr:PP2C family protein-serine/threonine phosphatase [Modestobacter sp. VKM Ac-2984]MCZ2815099.1 PP2C family protein-serine/threonine phosphatase [Modestobacter sp. VKM Ac-2984]
MPHSSTTPEASDGPDRSAGTGGTDLGFTDDTGQQGKPESLGERLLGSLIDRAHVMPPRLLAPLLAQEIVAVGGRDVTVYLQDYDQAWLRPLPGEGLTDTDPVPVEGSWAGRAFSSDTAIEQSQDDGGMRLFLPMLDGSDRVGVLAFTLPRVDDDDRRLARRLAGLAADMIVTKGAYTDSFFLARASRPMSLPAQLQWQLLPPLTMTTPRVAVAGILEPAYDVGGDSFDYALNDHVLGLAIIDAMGHGLDAATMATVAIAAYRHARRAGVSLVDLYAEMDSAIAAQFPGRFATAQMGELDVSTGELTWVNAGHPAPLLLRGRRVVAELTGATTRPVGFGGATPSVQTRQLEPGDRVLFYTDGVVEERLSGGEQFGEDRLVDLLERAGAEGINTPETIRRLSRALMSGRDGKTSDDTTLLLVEWTGPGGEDELRRVAT